MTSPGFRPNEDDVRRVQKELLKRAGVGFFSCTLDGELLSLDDGCLRIFDIADQYPDPAALTGQNITALILEKGDSHDIIRAALQQADTHRDYEIQLTTLQGHVKWVLLNTIRIPGLPAGVQVVQAIIRDITECKSTEEALRESEVFIRTLVDNLPIDFWAMDTDGRYSMQNPLSIEYWGNLIGRHPEEVEMPQEVIESWRSNNRRVMAGETIHSEASFTINGLQRTFLQIVAPVRRDHHILGILGVDVD
ncbi:MAG TPA: PAS domain S-box protein, partial [Armatimonadota bacterium]|nr:PAS domain S-box protein [Armatimonadota bacterium]